MVKISFIASGIILGLATISSASASLISRGFLDEALENYATNTALDLKANLSDLTALSNKIGTLPDGITLENFYTGWVDSGGESMAKYIANQGGKSIVYTYDPVNDDFRPERFSDVGYLDVLVKLMDGEGFTPAENSALAPFWYLTKRAMRVGEIPYDRTAAGMIDEINTKIGTLPSGEIIPSKGLAFLLPDTDYTYPTSIGDFMEQMYDGYWGISVLAEAVYYGNEFMGQTDTTRQVKGLRQITDEIGTLPRGSLINQTPFTDDLYKSTQGTESPVYPNSMAELVKQIYGEFSSSGNQPGLVHLLITGFPHNGGLPINSDFIGILPAMMLAENANSVANTANETAQANTAKIGTLPTEIVIGNSNGSIDMFNITKRQSVSLPKDYTLSDFIQDMYYGSFGVNAGLDSSPFYGLSDIIDHVMYGGITGEASPLIDKQYKGLIDLTLEINKIGDLPSGEFPEFPGSEFLFPWLNQPLTYPTSLAELITAIYGNSETGVGLLAAIITGFPVDRDGDGGTDEYAGLLPNLDLTKDAIDLANANATKIGTVPDGKNLAGMISETDAKIGAISPNTTVSDMISKTNAKFGVLPPDTTVAGMIGTLPGEYSTVGAALTAMKSDIDAKNLPSTSDDGQYVLSAKKVGDTITYTWVKMDLTNEEQAQ